MSARLATVDEGRRAFLADAAHELRTPLSIISGQLEAIEDGIYPADAEHLAPIHEQIAVLEQLIDDLRTVALAEAGALTLKLAPTDIGAAIDHAVAAFQPQATAKGVALGADYPASLPSRAGRRTARRPDPHEPALERVAARAGRRPRDVSAAPWRAASSR